MDYSKKLKHHFRPKKGWINDPNGLVYFDGYYHIFYQHSPNFEVPWNEPMHWGHARTKDFLEFEELPVALYPDTPYDNGGCWSGTAIVKDDTLYLFYASIYTPEDTDERIQQISVAYSKDGINFTKYEKNPILAQAPTDGGPDFRDPAVILINGEYYMVIATGNKETETGRLLLYKGENMFDWEYKGVLAQWENCIFAECPSFVSAEDGKYLLSATVCPTKGNGNRYFSVMYGTFDGSKFTIETQSILDKGPDQYAGQMFQDHKGRNILITWAPGWRYGGYAKTDLGHMSVPRHITVKDGKIHGYPIKEVWHLLKGEDDSVKMTDEGFVIERTGREPVVYKGKVEDIKIIRDEYLTEVFVNGGKEVYTALL